jgi:TP901 family phage tail tape measure protein
VAGDLGDLVARLKVDTSSLDAAIAKTHGLGSAIGAGFALAGAAIVGVGVVAVDMAAKFQSATTQLVTGAGESVANIALIRKGLLDLAPAVGVGPIALAKALFYVESAGYHGAASLEVLRVAAEGAKVGNADMTVVADALTTALNAYHLPASDAVKVMNDLTAAVSLGKLHMEDLASAMGAIVPIAAALGVPLDQITGAISTMTVQGTNAAKASQSLRFLLSAMAGPTAAAAKEMAGLGIGMAQIPGITKSVSDELGKLGLHTSEVSYALTHEGLVAALKLITDAIGKQFPVGSAAYEAALKGAVGGTRGLTAALELTGKNMPTLIGNISTIDGKVKGAGGSISGWALIQKDFNQKMDSANAGMQTFLIKIGTLFLPYLSQIADWFTKHVIPAMSQFADWFAKKGLPALISFGGWLGQYIIGPFNNIVSSVLPPVVTALSGVIDWLKKVGALSPLIAAIAVAFVAWKLATVGTWLLDLPTKIGNVTTASNLLNASLLKNPFVLVAAGAVAFAGGLYELLHNAQKVVPYMNGDVTPAFQLGANVFDAIGGGIHLAIHQLDLLLSWVETNGNKLGAAFKHVGDLIVSGLVGGIKAAVNTAIGAINLLISGVDSVLSMAHNLGVGPSWSIPKIPQWRASGGPVIGGSPYIVGERGPELFTPSSSGSITPNNMLGGGSVSIVQHFHGTTGAMQEMQAMVHQENAKLLASIQAGRR